MIKGIMLDMGGVLLDLDLPACIERFRTECGFERIDEFMHTTHHKGFLVDLESGMIGPEDFYRECHKYCNPDVSEEKLRDCFSSLVIGMAPDKAEYIKDLHRRYPLFILSNNNAVMMPHNSSLFDKAGVPLKDYFKDVFLSFEFKTLKPRREFFEKCIERTGLRAEEILFVDDSQANVDAAAECGLKAVFYPVGTSLRDTVESALQ